MNDLPLKIGERHCIVVNNAKRADTGCSKILQDGSPEPACPDDKNTGILEFLLPCTANLLHDNVAGVAFEFCGARALLGPANGNPGLADALGIGPDCFTSRFCLPDARCSPPSG